jgi:hypothetical protein
VKNDCNCPGQKEGESIYLPLFRNSSFRVDGRDVCHSSVEMNQASMDNRDQNCNARRNDTHQNRDNHQAPYTVDGRDICMISLGMNQALLNNRDRNFSAHGNDTIPHRDNQEAVPDMVSSRNNDGEDFVLWRMEQGCTTTLDNEKRNVERFVREDLFPKVKFVTEDKELEYKGKPRCCGLGGEKLLTNHFVP